MENFSGHLTAEMCHGELFANVDDFLKELAEFMAYYHIGRIQEGLEDMTPIECRHHAVKQQPT